MQYWINKSFKKELYIPRLCTVNHLYVYNLRNVQAESYSLNIVNIYLSMQIDYKEKGLDAFCKCKAWY